MNPMSDADLMEISRHIDGPACECPYTPALYYEVLRLKRELALAQIPLPLAQPATIE